MQASYVHQEALLELRTVRAVGAAELGCLAAAVLAVGVVRRAVVVYAAAVVTPDGDDGLGDGGGVQTGAAPSQWAVPWAQPSRGGPSGPQHRVRSLVLVRRTCEAQSKVKLGCSLPQGAARAARYGTAEGEAVWEP